MKIFISNFKMKPYKTESSTLLSAKRHLPFSRISLPLITQADIIHIEKLPPHFFIFILYRLRPDTKKNIFRQINDDSRAVTETCSPVRCVRYDIIFPVSVLDRHPPDACRGIQTEYRRDVPVRTDAKIFYVTVFL